MTTPNSRDVARKLCESISHVRNAGVILMLVGSRQSAFQYPSFPPKKIGDLIEACAPLMFQELRSALAVTFLAGLGRLIDPPEMHGGSIASYVSIGRSSTPRCPNIFATSPVP